MDFSAYPRNAQVLFGSQNGQRTRGTVIGYTRTKVKVRQDEARGVNAIGTIWTVTPDPQCLVLVDAAGATAAGGTSLPAAPTPDPANEPLPPFLSCVQRHCVLAIAGVYFALEPERLTCDGEASAAQINRTRRQCQMQLDALFRALGRPVNEQIATAYWQQAYDKLPRGMQAV